MRIIVLLLFQFILLGQLTAQVDTTASQSTENPAIRSNPEYNFTGTEEILGTDTTINEALIENLLQDTTVQDSVAIAQQDSIRESKKNDIETTINYTARDSMTFDLKGQKLYLYGETHIDYGNIALDADETTIDWNQRTIKAKFTTDTLGRKRGKPVFSQGSDVFETEDILYNFKTRRAIIKGVVTEQDGAFMHGEDVKKNEENELFIKHAKYTTCNLSDPHFFIESKKIKVVPGNKVVSGPFNMKFREVPTPLWFPFGMFPQPKEKASGIVFPSYGEENRRGFFLRDGGYYFGFSEYADLRITGDIYSKGGHAINALTNYKLRYKFNGSLSFSYNKNSFDNPENALEPSVTKDYWVRWSHRPETRGNANFSASVNAGTSTYNSNNNVAISDLERSISSQFSSNVSYSQRFRGTPFNMTANLRHNQNVQTGVYNMTFPGLTINMNRIHPLKNLVKSSSSPLAKLNFSHNFVATNEFTNAPVRGFQGWDLVEGEGYSDTLRFNFNELGNVYDRAKIGGRHSIPISTSFTLLKYFTVSPSINYEEVWYTRKLDYNGGYNEELGGVDVDTLEGFSRAGSWRSGASLNTRVYGMYYLKGIPGIEAIRHVMTPSVSFSYSPEINNATEIQIDSTGRTAFVTPYEGYGFAYGSPQGRESKTIGFSLTNNLEMKVRTPKDTANEFKKVKIFDNLSLNSGYNLAADSFNLSNITWNARTSFFQQKVSVTMTGAFDPYQYIDDGTSVGQRVNRFAWNNGQGLGTLQRLNTAISFSLAPKKGKGARGNTDEMDPNMPPGGRGAFDNEEDILNSQYGTEEEKEYVLQNPEEYVDFDLPWSLRVSYSINRSKRGLEDAEITAHTVSLNGTLGLTGKTQITFNTYYDVKNQAFATTRIGVSRDLHCWTMNFSWVPFGRQQSFALTIRPKSALLQDLKLEKRRSFYDFFSR